jgi:hypothetical protein
MANQRDEVLKRLLKTPPKPRQPKDSKSADEGLKDLERVIREGAERHRDGVFRKKDEA